MSGANGSEVAFFISPKDRWILHEVAVARNSSKDPSWTRRKGRSFNDVEANELGLWGEFAAASYLGCHVDTRISSLGDDGHDLRLGDYRVGVKFTHKWRQKMIIEPHKRDREHDGFLYNFQCDLMILAKGLCDPPRKCVCHNPGHRWVALPGWIWREDFMRLRKYTQMALGPRWTVEQEELTPMHYLWKL